MSIFNTDNILEQSPLKGALSNNNKQKEKKGLIDFFVEGTKNSVWNDFDFPDEGGVLLNSIKKRQEKRERLSNSFFNESDMIDTPDEEERVIRDAFDETYRLQNKINKVAQDYNLPQTQEPQSQSVTNQSTVAGNSNTNGFTTGNQYSSQMFTGGTAGYIGDKVREIQDIRETQRQQANTLNKELSSYEAYYDTTNEIGSSLQYLSRFFT